MADLDVQPKKTRPKWLWILLALIGLALLFFLLRGGDREEEEETTTTTTETTAPITIDPDAQENLGYYKALAKEKCQAA